MSSFDDLPQRHKTHITEDKAELAFQNLLASSEDFVLQASDRKDYGTDYQIEVVNRGSVTNVRVQVQLKGTERDENTDGTISVEIKRSNLNYLLMQPHSFFVCYHAHTETLRFCSADAVIRRYEHSGQNWTEQKTLTVIFSEFLTVKRLKSLAALARARSATLRDRRVTQTLAHPEELPRIVKSARLDLHVPEDKDQAATMLSRLFGCGADDEISAAFDQFSSVFSQDDDAMIFCYMAEINLGMARLSIKIERIMNGISYLESKLQTGRFEAGSIYYSIGNGFSAIGQEDNAVKAYELALKHMLSTGGNVPIAECYKNLGTSYEKLCNGERAVECFREALRHDPLLAEAHFALGIDYHRRGEFEKALEHFDQVVFAEFSPAKKKSSVSGWRINLFFNLGDGKAAFREINALLNDTKEDPWIWPWCAQQVANFGRTSLDNARLSIPFWNRYLKIYENCPSGVREKLLNKLYLRSEDQAGDLIYLEFKTEFEAGIQYVQGEAKAYLWDRLGHWAQEDDNWEEAERCFRVAYDLAGGNYGYCLGTALNFLDRPKDSLPILLPQAEDIQPDDMSWFQVAVAYEKLGRASDSIDAYKKVIELNPNYELAWFNMGGVYWNARKSEEASRVWKTAVDKFPNHELTALLRRNLPFLFNYPNIADDS